MLAAGVLAVPAAESVTATAISADPQIRVQIGNNRRNRNRNRSVIRTRIVRRAGGTYRETYRITYHRNGRVTQQVISRVRIGRY